MTNEMFLTKIYSAVRLMEPNDRKIFDTLVAQGNTYIKQHKELMVSAPAMFASTVCDIKDEICQQEAKNNGKAKALAAGKRILKRAASSTTHKRLWYADEYKYHYENMQVLCDGRMFLLLVMEDHLNLDSVPEGIKDEQINYASYLSEPWGDEIQLPELKLLKTEVLIKKKLLSGKSSNKRIVLDLGVLAVDTDFLIDILEILGDKFKAFASGKSKPLRACLVSFNLEIMPHASNENSL